MDTVEYITPEQVCSTDTFKAILSDQPIIFEGLYPSSLERDARTDLAIAFIKSGLVEYDDSYGIPLRVKHPFILHNHVYSPNGDERDFGRHTRGGCSLKLSWVDWDRVQEEV